MIEQSLSFLANAGIELNLVVFRSSREFVDEGRYRDNFGLQSMTQIEMASTSEILLSCPSWAGRAAQEILYDSPRARRTLRSTVKGVQPDVIVCDMQRTAQFFYDHRDARKVFDLDDLLSDRYAQFLERGDVEGLAGTYANRLPGPLRWVTGRLGRVLARREAKLMRIREADATRNAHAVLLTSALEAAELARRSGSRNIYPNSPAVRPQPPMSAWKARSAPNCDLFFMGNMATIQNREAFEYIRTALLPIICQKHPYARLHVVGLVKDDMAGACTGLPIVFHGFVPNPAKIALQCDLALLPVMSGTGVKTKVLDALAIGIPVITNRKGAEGLPLEDGRNAFVRDSTTQIASAVDLLMSSRLLAGEMGRAGYEFVCSAHDAQMLREQFLLHVFGSEETPGLRVPT